MREKTITALSAFGGLALLINLYNIFFQLPDEAQQGAIYRIMFFHIPAAWTGMTLVFLAMIFSIAYLVFRDMRFDAWAVAATEVGLVFLVINIVTGSIWGRIIWGIWWAWDYRLTSALVACLLYAGYLAVRPAMSDPTQRATISAIVSIFASVDLPIVWFSIRWWRTQHPGPVIETNGLPHDMLMALLYNWIAIMFIAWALVLLRLRSERVEREVESMRRLAHAL
jgi:heme exporter protein C